MEEMVVFFDGWMARKSISEATSCTILKVARFNHPTWSSVDVFSQSPPPKFLQEETLMKIYADHQGIECCQTKLCLSGGLE